MDNTQNNNSPKFAFFYMLSLVALAFMAVSAGIIIFQIINKHIVDVLSSYKTCYSSGALKFAISSIIISAPICYVLSWQINKDLFIGNLKSESGIRKQLIYFIIFISSVVALGYLVAIIYNFLDGELTTKFALKAVTALAISGTILSYYVYEIKREVIAGIKNKVVKVYFWVTLSIVVITLISGFIFVESPNQTRMKKFDGKILENFDNIKYAVENFYYSRKRLPGNLEELIPDYISTDDIIINMASGKKYEYEILTDNKYKICADFQTSNQGGLSDCYSGWLDNEWSHDKGYRCFEKTAQKEKEDIAPDLLPMPKS